MNKSKKEVFDQFIEAVGHPFDGHKLFFVDGPGGTGKSFLLEQYLAHVCFHKKVAIAVASSGIAATLLTGGHTAHSTFRIPLPWQSQEAELIRNASLISWDEALMMHRASFEAVNRCFCDIIKYELEQFGGKVMVFSGDHRQILPVLKDATRAETLEAFFKSSPLWNHLQKVRPTENMRVRTAPDPASAAELAEFSAFLLQIGEGRYPVNSDISENDICLPHDMCIIPEERGHYRWDEEEHKESEDMEAPPNFNLLPAIEAPLEVDNTNPDDDCRERNVNALIGALYPEVDDNNIQDEYFVDRAILVPTNASVRRINEMVADCGPSNGRNKGLPVSRSLEGVADPNVFEEAFLKSLNFSGIPLHKIALKVRTPIIMIRNFNSDAGLCYETRLPVVSLRERSIEATIMSGTFKEKTVCIWHIGFYSGFDDIEFPFKLRWKQFPVVPAFVMTIYKDPGQPIHHVGIYLKSPVFAHGQLYVALSRMTSRKVIKIAVDPSSIDENRNIHTKNIVFREVFEL
ncbi:Helitron helicase [Phytophthora megakarya]|uniref:ATP-dependent DNA helicase n=1 Tax=Phytophthora megakarya TaxID=4795 RepID=A0A225WLC0_9STRA|nr:Helitron helicase [Phytophthora megakarya]